MNNMNTQHITEQQIEQYLDFLMKRDLEKLDPEEITQIELHMSDCESCAEEMAQEYEIEEFIDNWSFSKHKKTVEQAKMLRILQKHKKSTTLEAIQRLSDKLIDNITKMNQNTLEIYLQAKKKGKRLLSQITFDASTSPFQYALSAESARNGEEGKKTQKMTSVMTSNELRDRINVDLDEKNKQLTVTIKTEQTDKEQKLVLLNIDTTDESRQLLIETGKLDEKTGSVVYTFNDLEKGKYFLFFEPDSIV